MKKILLILTIFSASLAFEGTVSAATTHNMSANIFSGIFGSDGVSHKSAHRFSTPKMGHARRGKFTCMRKHGCAGGRAKVKTEKTPCKARG
jgi:hypothetical protein